jgi:hypothetical protein
VLRTLCWSLLRPFSFFVVFFGWRFSRKQNSVVVAVCKTRFLQEIVKSRASYRSKLYFLPWPFGYVLLENRVSREGTMDFSFVNSLHLDTEHVAIAALRKPPFLLSALCCPSPSFLRRALNCIAQRIIPPSETLPTRSTTKTRTRTRTRARTRARMRLRKMRLRVQITFGPAS